MALFPDLVSTYDNLQTTWQRVRTDVYSHLFVGLLLIGIGGVRIPTFALSIIDPHAVLEEPWFKFLKETNLLLLAPVMVVGCFFLYALLLRAIGASLVSLQLILIPPRFESWLITPTTPTEDLATLAATIGKSDFSVADLTNTFSRLSLKYTGKNKGELQTMLEVGQAPNRTAKTYWGNASFFFVAWVVLFILLPQNEWVMANKHAFSKSVAILLLLVLWGRLRFMYTLPLIHSALTISVSQLVQSDPDFREVLAKAEPDLPAIRKRIESFKQEQRVDRPSLIRYVWMRKREGITWEHTDTSLTWFERGRQFQWDHDKLEKNPRAWLRDYFAFRCFRLIEATRRAVHALVLYVRYLLRGAP